jgi:pilus assembly protein TadC
LSEAFFNGGGASVLAFTTNQWLFVGLVFLLGIVIGMALRVLSAEFRNDRMMRAEEKAARLPAIMTVPLILFILPTLFIVILGPAACSINDSFING